MKFSLPICRFFLFVVVVISLSTQCNRNEFYQQISVVNYTNSPLSAYSVDGIDTTFIFTIGKQKKGVIAGGYVYRESKQVFCNWNSAEMYIGNDRILLRVLETDSFFVPKKNNWTCVRATENDAEISCIVNK